MPLGTCHLCLREQDLKKSHIIPAFVFRWLKETSGTGYLRFSDDPNRRAQDGAKQYLLCGECEQRLCKEAEEPFAKEIFLPLCREEKESAEYGSWMLKFSVSLSWRVVIFLRSRGEFSHFCDEQKAALTEAMDTWRRFLLGEIPHPGEFEQHLLPLQWEISQWPGGAPANLNRWAQRYPEMDIVSSSDISYVYVKLPRFLFFGFIKVARPKDWIGTKLSVKKGEVGSTNYQIPEGVAQYLKDRMRICGGVARRISPRQTARIRQAIQNDLDRASNSDAFRALNLDVTSFGQGRVFGADDKS